MPLRRSQALGVSAAPVLQHWCFSGLLYVSHLRSTLAVALRPRLVMQQKYFMLIPMA